MSMENVLKIYRNHQIVSQHQMQWAGQRDTSQYRRARRCLDISFKKCFVLRTCPVPVARSAILSREPGSASTNISPPHKSENVMCCALSLQFVNEARQGVGIMLTLHARSHLERMDSRPSMSLTEPPWLWSQPLS